MAKSKKITKRYYKKSGRWSSNIQEISTSVVNADPGANFVSYTLATNPVQDITTTSQVFTTKNFDISFTLESNANSTVQPANVEDMTAYVMYVPQGMNVTSSYNNQHPEYVLNYKYYGSPSTDSAQQFQPYKLRTRLARKLNTGDSIILFLKYNWQSTTGVSGTVFEIHGVVRWWTKAN